MPQRFRAGWVALVLAAAPTWAGAQPTTRAKDAPAAAKAKAGKPAAPPNEVVATVNGEPITRVDVVRLLVQQPIPPGSEREAYEIAVDSIIDHILVTQFLARQNTKITEKEIDDELASLNQELKENKSDLATFMAQNNFSMPQMRKKAREALHLKKYLEARDRDPELRKFVGQNKDLFNRTKVTARHILLKVPPRATPAQKEQVRRRLLQIKKEIESGKISFADAARKHSQDDPANAKAGGELVFYRNSHLVSEDFLEAAFALKPGVVSDPIETPLGYHLMQVVERKEGTPIDFAQHKDEIREMYDHELIDQIADQERKTAKITRKPMPPDMFVSSSAPAPAPANAPPSGAPARPRPEAKKGAR